MTKIKFLTSVSIFMLPLLINACGGSKETTEEQKQLPKSDSVYVFDQPLTPTHPGSIALRKDSLEVQPKVIAPNIEVKYYIVQIGAFTTKEKAEEFAEMAKNNLKYKIEISFSNNINLYVVQLSPPYSEKQEAEAVRNELWKSEKFKDAWILTVTK